MSTFGENLKRLREKKGLTQDRLAELSGVTQNTIAAYETRGQQPRAKMKKRFMDVLDCTEEELYGYKDGAAHKHVTDGEAIFNSLDADTIASYDKNLHIPVSPTILKTYGTYGYTDIMESQSVNKRIPVGSHLYYIPEGSTGYYNKRICAILHNGHIMYRRVYLTPTTAILEAESWSREYKPITCKREETVNGDYKIIGRVVWFEHLSSGI